MDKSRSKMSEVIIFKVPKSVKEELEQFCKVNGYNISDAVRMAIESQFLSPEMKTQAELWKEMLEWKESVNQWQKDVKDILKIIARVVDKQDVQTQVLFRILETLTGQPIRQILTEELEKKKAEKES
jgi:antitoxin component of RelBE/YafQ-DinJ toxin-antitoxin module